MRTHYFYIIAVTALLSGCATNQIGVDTSTADNNRLGAVMAKDVSNHLEAYYPPAHTTFCFDEAKASGYEKQMIASFRAKGYGVSCPGTQIVINMDKVGSAYVASYSVDEKVFSRAYMKSGENVKPLSSWSNGGI